MGVISDAWQSRALGRPTNMITVQTMAEKRVRHKTAGKLCSAHVWCSVGKDVSRFAVWEFETLALARLCKLCSIHLGVVKCNALGKKLAADGGGTGIFRPFCSIT